MTKKRIFITLLAILSAQVLRGEKALSLKDCIRLSLDNHPAIKVSDEDRKLAISGYNLATARNNIIINSAIKTVERVNSNASSESLFRVPGIDTNIGLFAGVMVNYLIYDGTRPGTERSARLTIDMSKVSAFDKESELTFNVKKAYYEYLLARDILTLNRRLLDNVERKLQKVQQLYRVGQRPILDVSKMEVAQSEARLDYEESRYRSESALNQLHVAMGVPGNRAVIGDLTDEETPMLKFDTEKLFQYAELYNPSLKLYNIRREINKVKVEIERAGRHPTVEVYFALGFENQKLYGFDQIILNFYPSNWSPVFSWTFQLTLPIYLGGATEARIDSAKSSYTKVVYEEKEVRLNLQNQINTMVQNLASYENKMRLSELMINNAEKHLLLATKSYDSGAGSQLELQDAEISVIRAKMAFVTARYGYYLTLSAISRIIGVPEEQICLQK